MARRLRREPVAAEAASGKGYSDLQPICASESLDHKRDAVMIGIHNPAATVSAEAVLTRYGNVKGFFHARMASFDHAVVRCWQGTVRAPGSCPFAAPTRQILHRFSRSFEPSKSTGITFALD